MLAESAAPNPPRPPPWADAPEAAGGRPTVAGERHACGWAAPARAAESKAAVSTTGPEPGDETRASAGKDAVHRRAERGRGPRSRRREQRDQGDADRAADCV